MRPWAILVFVIAAFAGIAITWQVTRLRPHTFRANAQIARMDLDVIARAVEAYAQAHGGVLPGDLADLLGKGPGDPGLLDRTTLPRDPWKHPYGYSRNADGRGFRVWSCGADGATGGSGEAQDLAVEVTGSR